jgi:hypothetical protein
MTDYPMSMFVSKEARDETARKEAEIASRLVHAKVVTKLQETGSRWTLQAKPKEVK